jgi:DNA-binding XRE family transcriptional regulator
MNPKLIRTKAQPPVSVFKIIYIPDYLKGPLDWGWAALGKTLGSARHKALIELLIAKREAAGMTQAELAKKLGEYQSFVARLESGQRRVDVVEFLELADILEFDAAKALRSLK